MNDIRYHWSNYPPPDPVVKCIKCGYRLGLQDPGNMCGHCKSIKRGIEKMRVGIR